MSPGLKPSAPRRTLVFAFLCLLWLLPANAQEKKTPWTDYHSERWMFCAAFPSGWHPEELFDGILFRAKPHVGHDNDPVITLGGYEGKNYEGHYKSLEELADDAQDDLRDQMVSQLRATNTDSKIQGSPALVTRQSYLRGSAPWSAKHILVQREDGVIMELSLSGPDEEFERLLPQFDEMVASRFQRTCAGLPQEPRNSSSR